MVGTLCVVSEIVRIKLVKGLLRDPAECLRKILEVKVFTLQYLCPSNHHLKPFGQFNALREILCEMCDFTVCATILEQI